MNRETLQRLRRFVSDIAKPVRSVPIADLLDAAHALPQPASVTIDFEAARDLGHPMVVVRIPTEDPPNELAVLSPREREVARLIAAGLSNKQIARRLHIALATVKDHVHRILTKASLPNRAAVAAAAGRLRRAD